MLSPLVLFGFLRAARNASWKGWIFFILSLSLLYTLIGTASRSSFLALVAALVPFLWFLRRKRLHVLLILVSIAALLYQQPFMLYRTGLLAGAAVSRAAEFGDDHPSLIIRSLKELDAAIGERMPVQKDGHIESMMKTLERVRVNPMLGYGVGNLIGEYSTPESRWHVEHNRYLFILSTAGLLSVVPYVLFVLSLLWLAAWKAVPAGMGSRDADCPIGILLFPAVFFFTLQLNNCGQERYYYWVFFGLAAAWIRNTTLTELHENPSH